MENNLERPAGFWIRFLASLLDGIVLFVPLRLIGMLFPGEAAATGDVTAVPVVTTWDVISSILQLLYWIIVPVIWSGYTIGKRIVGIRIAKVDGERLGLGTMLLRQLLGGIIYVVTLGIGTIVSAFMVGLRQDKRAIHDFIAGTYVTYKKP